MKQPSKPTLAQKKLIAGAGLDPEKWMVRHENRIYLYIVDRGIKQRQLCIINRKTGRLEEPHERQTGETGHRGEGDGTDNAHNQPDRGQALQTGGTF